MTRLRILPFLVLFCHCITGNSNQPNSEQAYFAHFDIVSYNEGRLKTLSTDDATKTEPLFQVLKKKNARLKVKELYKDDSYLLHYFNGFKKEKTESYDSQHQEIFHTTRDFEGELPSKEESFYPGDPKPFRQLLYHYVPGSKTLLRIDTFGADQTIVQKDYYNNIGKLEKIERYKDGKVVSEEILYQKEDENVETVFRRNGTYSINYFDKEKLQKVTNYNNQREVISEETYHYEGSDHLSYVETRFLKQNFIRKSYLINGLHKDIEEDYVGGKIKSRVHYNESGIPSKIEEFSESGAKVIGYGLYDYNFKDRSFSVSLFDPSDRLREKKYYTVDGKLSKKEFFDGSDNAMTKYMIFFYTADGKMKKSDVYSKDDKLLKSECFDDQLKLISC